MKIAQGDWIVVCDGRKALVLENRSDTKAPSLHKIDVLEHADLPTHELGSDRPGRVYESSGGRRSAVEEHDWHDMAEQEFIDRLVKYLEDANAKGERRYMIVAAPRALGHFRKVCHGAIRPRIVCEIAGDWVKMPISEIEHKLVAHQE